MELTPDNVRHLLEASFDSNQVKRQEAEFQLKQFEQFDGFIQVLSLVLNSNVSDSLKQAVAITIKNRVRRSWSGSDTPIGPQDKLFLKSNIINFIVTVNIKSRYVAS